MSCDEVGLCFVAGESVSEDGDGESFCGVVGDFVGCIACEWQVCDAFDGVGVGGIDGVIIDDLVHSDEVGHGVFEVADAVIFFVDAGLCGGCFDGGILESVGDFEGLFVDGLCCEDA